MIESLTAFWNSTCQWFVNNKDAITAFFMSGQAVSFVAAVVMLVKNLRSTKDNTAQSKRLDETLTNTNGMSESLTTLDENFQLLKAENDSLRTELKNTEDKLQSSNQEIINKLNAIVEVQSIVYSTIRDDGVRQTVNTILNNARYNEENFKQSLEIQIDELKQKYNEEFQKVNDMVTKSIDEVKNGLNAAKVAEKTLRNRTDDVTRY